MWWTTKQKTNDFPTFSGKVISDSSSSVCYRRTADETVHNRWRKLWLLLIFQSLALPFEHELSSTISKLRKMFMIIDNSFACLTEYVTTLRREVYKFVSPAHASQGNHSDGFLLPCCIYLVYMYTKPVDNVNSC